MSRPVRLIVGHCHERILTNQDTIDERGAFESVMRLT